MADAPAPKTKDIKAMMHRKLKESDIVIKDAKKLKLTPITRSQSKALKLPQACGFRIPYFNIQGKSTDYFRIRYLEQPLQKGFNAQLNRKAPKYSQVANTNPQAYFPPINVNWESVIKNKDLPLVITEGELKAICACKCGIPTIGLGGVWSFKSKKQVVSLIPDLVQVEWRNRIVYIVYDADAAHNPKVLQAENALAQELVDRGAQVHIVRLPDLKEVDKTGLDDFLVIRGKSAFGELLDTASYEFNRSAALHRLNCEVNYVVDPGFIIILETGLRITSNNFTTIAYSNRYHDAEVVGKDGSVSVKKVKTAIAWKDWPFRSDLDKMTYSPGGGKIIPTVAGYKEIQGMSYNTWNGWGVPSIKGDIKLWKELLIHIFGDDKVSLLWFEKWAAYPIQHPGTKLLTATVVWGLVEGSGKTLIGHTLMRIYGDNAGEIHDTELRDPDNPWAENKQFILADDITGHNNRELANRLKTLVTQKTVHINIKYVPNYTLPDCINYYFTSNDVDAFFLSNQDRRYFIHEVLAGKPDPKWLKKFLQWRDSDTKGISALRHYLENLNLGDFDPGAPAPKTASKEMMVSITRSDLNDWISNLGHRGDLLINGIKQNGDLWTSSEILRQYDPEGRTNVKANGVARELSKSGYRQLKQIRTDFGMIRLYALRNASKWSKAKPNVITKHYEDTCPEAARFQAEKEASKPKKRFRSKKK